MSVSPDSWDRLEKAMKGLREARARFEARSAEYVSDLIPWEEALQKLGYTDAQIRDMRNAMSTAGGTVGRSSLYVSGLFREQRDMPAGVADRESGYESLGRATISVDRVCSGLDSQHRVTVFFFVAVCASAFGAWVHSRTVSREHAHVKRPLS